MQTSCHKRRAECKGFTLFELLAVMCIIGLLAAALTVPVRQGMKNARQADCKSKLRQFGIAITIYRGEHDNQVPPWISHLYPEYVDDRSTYVCFADLNKGLDRIRPAAYVADIQDQATLDGTQFRDNKTGSDSGRDINGTANPVQACSYFFEFSNATCPYGAIRQNPPTPYRMSDFKEDQMTLGDENSGVDAYGVPLPYSASAIPIIRCYHHWSDQRIPGVTWINRGSRKVTKERMTLNVAYAGNVFVGPPWWEGTIRPGATR